MTKAEVELINAICHHKDFASVLEAGVGDMFVAYKDIWNKLLKHTEKYREVPSIDLLTKDSIDMYEVPVTSGIQYYIDTMRDQYIANEMKRVINEGATGLKTNGSAKALDEIINGLNVLARKSGVVKDLNITNYEDAIEDFKNRKKQIDEHGSLGILTGIAPLDRAYPTGMAGGHFIVVIGWSGYGKTAFATYLACQAWRHAKRPMIVSLEMSAEEMRDRIYTTLGNGEFNHRNITRGDIDVGTFEEWSENNFKHNKDFIVVSSEGFENVTLNTVQAKIDQYKPDLVILDYLQLFDDAQGGGNEVTKIRNISKDSKRLAIRNNIPVIGITQATQDSKADLNEPPLIEQVAWSKGIQHDADLAMAAHRVPGQDDMEVVARKNRHGSLFAFELEVDMERGIWREHYGDADSDVIT